MKISYVRRAEMKTAKKVSKTMLNRITPVNQKAILDTERRKDTASKAQERCNEKVTIESPVPILTLLDMEIVHSLNAHGRLHIKAVIEHEQQPKCFSSFYQNEQIQVFDATSESPVLIFCGKIQATAYEMQGQLLIASIQAVSYSVDLEGVVRNRSFQNPSLTFESIVAQVMEGIGGRFLWHAPAQQRIGTPFIQYEETDWDFLKRLISHLNQPLHVSVTTDRPDVYIGINRGRQRDLSEATILKRGRSNRYYTGGGFREGHSRLQYRYLRVRHDCSSWQMGDFVRFENGRFTIFERTICFEKGELFYLDTMGEAGFLYQATMGNEAFRGLQLSGSITRVERESVYIQFDFDQERRADYAWPWVPEVGNLCYIMPEVGSKVLLSFASDQEQDGAATHLLRTSGVPMQASHKEFATVHNKQLGLYPEGMVLKGQGRAATLSMMDESGIELDTDRAISLQARDRIVIRAGRRLTIRAPKQVLMQTNQANVELNQDFNLFAPSGVRTR